MLDRKAELFQSYLTLSCKLINALIDDDLDQVEQQMNQRDAIIRLINAIDQEQNEILVNDEIRKIILKIQEVDRELVKLMTIKKDEASHQLREIMKGKQLQHSYIQKYDQTDGIFYDKRK